jgi:hypothetical protein
MEEALNAKTVKRVTQTHLLGQVVPLTTERTE